MLMQSVLHHRLQFCIALLDRYSTMEAGRVTLVHWDGTIRVVEDSFQHELQRMQVLAPLDRHVFHPGRSFSTVDGSDNRAECSIPWFVDNWTVVTERHPTPYGVIDIKAGLYAIPGQGLNLPVYFTYGSPAFKKLLHEMFLLWQRSFHVHRAYAVTIRASDGQGATWLPL
jgi:hypothetical protein